VSHRDPLTPHTRQRDIRGSALIRGPRLLAADRFTPLLKALGVNDVLPASSLVGALELLYREARGGAVYEEDNHTAVNLLNALAEVRA
jgi:hypothetical protein